MDYNSRQPRMQPFPFFAVGLMGRCRPGERERDQ
jgi:hypothetical protein